MAAGYKVDVHNNSTGNITVKRATGGDTINGAAKNIVLPPQQRLKLRVNAAANGYLIEESTGGLILDPTDPSKQAKWDVSGVATGTVITLTPPAAGGTLLTSSSTLTGAQAAEQLIGVPQTASNNATIDFASASYAAAFDGTLAEVTFHWQGVRPGTDAQVFEMRIGTGAGPTYQTGGSDYLDAGNVSDNSSVNSPFGSTRSYISLSGQGSIGNAATKVVNGRVSVDFLNNTAFLKAFSFNQSQTSSGGALQNVTGCGQYIISAAAITGVRFFFASGNIAEGKFWVTGKRLA